MVGCSYIFDGLSYAVWTCFTKYLFMSIGTKVSHDCQMEMIEHRKILMEDYRLSPEIVTHCSDDIKNFCNTLEVGGKTIHCLMEHTRTKKRKGRVSPQCQRAVSWVFSELA